MADLPNEVDVVVVGGGVMGASTAFHLAEAGVSVLLVEKNELASGSTSKAAGGVRAIKRINHEPLTVTHELADGTTFMIERGY